MPPTLLRRALPGALLLLAAAAPAASQAPETGAFVVRMGRDTLGVETYTRTADRLTGTIVTRAPRTTVRTYTATLRPDGSVSRVEVETRQASGPNAQARPTRAVLDVGADTSVLTAAQGDSTVAVRVAARGSHLVPQVGSFTSMAFYEQAFRRAGTLRADSLKMDLLLAGATRTYDLEMRRFRGDSAHLTNIAGLSRVRLDRRGRIVRWDGTGSTLKVIVERVPSVDLTALAASFAARDQAGQAVGTLSPRDSAQMAVGGATVAVSYGRPAKRGRRIFGEVVPWGQVWRTGANAATAFRTDRDLVIGGTEVPAGSYTLWTIPSPTGWKLIVNKQTGQWGTEYRPEHDLARIDMTREPAGMPVERFTIALEPRGAGGAIVMTWDDTRASVPFTVK